MFDLPVWEPDEYVETTWGDLVELRYGKGLKGYKGAVGEFPVYGTNGPVGFCDKPLCDFPSVVIGRKGAYRGVHYSDKPFFVIDTAFFVVPKFDINLKWVYYSLLTQDINGLDSGSAIPSTRREDFYALTAKVPPRSKQDEIVKNLDCLNFKIELNRQTNQTLEQIAQAIFKSWFVDFEPTRAKIAAKKRWQVINQTTECSSPTCYAEAFNAEQQGQNLKALSLEEVMEQAAMAAISGKALSEISQLSSEQQQQLKVTADLFPGELADSELGDVPEGWECLQWGSIARLEYGKGLKGYRDGEGNIPVFGTNGKIGLTDKSLFDKEGIIVGRKGAYRGVHYSSAPFYVIDTAFFISPLISLSVKWAYYEILRFDINGMDSGSAIPSTSRDDFYSLWSVFPPVEVQDEFDRLITMIFEKKSCNDSENESLGLLRDTLLPKLLSGELSIQEAEQNNKAIA